MDVHMVISMRISYHLEFTQQRVYASPFGTHGLISTLYKIETNLSNHAFITNSSHLACNDRMGLDTCIFFFISCFQDRKSEDFTIAL